MEKKITFVGQDHSPVLDRQINEQLVKIERFLTGERSPIFIDVLVEFHPVHQHNKVVAKVKSPHFNCYAEHEGPDVHVEINETIDRLYQQLRTEKQKIVRQHRQGCDKECRSTFFHDEVEEGDEE